MKKKEITFRAESADARTFEHPSGLRFHGIFDGNVVSMRTLQGRGTCVNLSNDAVLARYEGEFKNGRLDGQGTVTFKDGDIFTGSLLKDRPRQGILIKPDGSKFEVEFSQSGDTCFDLFKPKPMKSKTRLVTDNSAARSGDRPRLDGSGSAQKRGRSASPGSDGSKRGGWHQRRRKRWRGPIPLGQQAQSRICTVSVTVQHLAQVWQHLAVQSAFVRRCGDVPTASG